LRKCDSGEVGGVFLLPQGLRRQVADFKKAQHERTSPALPRPYPALGVPRMSRASEQAYAKIRAHLLSGALKPSEQLTEDQLAQITGVSRTPVREAVRRLEDELLLVRSGSKRLFVADWSRDDIEEMFTLRQMLECHAAERAARRMTRGQVAQMETTNAALKAAIELPAPDVAQFLGANRSFHDAIIEAAASPRLGQMLARLVEAPVVLRTARTYSLEDLRQSARDHDELIAAFAARDPEWARAVMGSHLRRAFHTFAQTVSAASSTAGSAASPDKGGMDA
jgi:DNA-binding GntR family transcriptional regulator